MYLGGRVVKNLPANAGGLSDVGSIPGVGRVPKGENGNPLQYSCLGNSMDRGIWQATTPRISKSWTWLSDWTHTTHSKYRHPNKHSFCVKVVRLCMGVHVVFNIVFTRKTIKLKNLTQVSPPCPWSISLPTSTEQITIFTSTVFLAAITTVMIH